MWDQIASDAPAVAALCLLVIAFGTVLWKIVRVFIATIASFMEQIHGLSKECHESHDRVAQTAAKALDRNTEAMGSCRQCQAETTKAMQEVAWSLKQLNGRAG